jgi:alpha-glucoside transport system permease protein
VTWIGNKRLGRIEVQEQKWTVNLELYPGQLQAGADGRRRPDHAPDGTVEMAPGQDMSQAFFNSLAVSVRPQ